MNELDMKLKKGAILATMEQVRDYLELNEMRSIERYIEEPLNKEDLELAEKMLGDIIQMSKEPMESLRTLNSYKN